MHCWYIAVHAYVTYIVCLTTELQQMSNVMYISMYCNNLYIVSGAFLLQSPDGKLVASGAIDGIINLFDLQSGRLLHTLEGVPLGA